MLGLQESLQIIMVAVRFHPIMSHFNEVREEILRYP